jgi:O-antigen ligase
MPSPANRSELLPIFGILVLSLWATITNFVPVSVSFAILAPAVPYLLYKNRTLPRSVVALLAMYGYFIVSTLAYAPASFIDPLFYRRDGNVFVTFMPVLIGGALSIRTDFEGLVRSFVRWVTCANSVFLGMFLVTGAPIFIVEPGIYHLLFESHNAAGGFLAMVISFSLGLYRGIRKTPLMALVLLVNGVALVLTFSRGSILGLAAAFALVVVFKERFIKSVVVAMVVGTVALMLYTYPLWVANSKPVGIYTPEGGSVSTGEISADANTADRVFFLWPRAVDLFFQSPLLGTGFGSFNDLPYNLVGIPHVLSFNRPSELVFSSSHAHNTYFHVLAETGLLGLGLLVFLLREVWKDIDSLEPQSVRLGLKLGFWFAVFSSFTEHRLFTPSEMLPFTILFGLALACRRSNRMVVQDGCLINHAA